MQVSRDAFAGGPFPGTDKGELFLSDLAVNGRSRPRRRTRRSTRCSFLYGQVLHQPFENVQAVRADRPVRVPVVLTPEEVKRVLAAMAGTPQLVAKLLYGSGLRLLEGLRLRVQDLDFEMKQLTVRDGKGAKDRYTVLARKPDSGVAAAFGAGAAPPSGGFARGVRVGVSARGIGPQVPQRGARMALAIRISCPGPVH